MLDRELFSQLPEAFHELERNFAALPAWDASVPGAAGMAGVLRELAQRLGDNYPYFHPLYAGQMLKPPHPIARAAYALATWINPNNHALDGGRASSAWRRRRWRRSPPCSDGQTHLGHLASGGTMANLEALWVAGQLHPGKKIVASSQAHYTHQRISRVLQVALRGSALRYARPDGHATRWQRMLAGAIWLRGGHRRGHRGQAPWTRCRRSSHCAPISASVYTWMQPTADTSRWPPIWRPETRAAFDLVGQADSLVIDPHKHGLQPYGCGAILFRDPSVGTLYQHESPYTYFSSHELHLGEISLECSRPGAAAAALWATQRLLPLTRGGEFAQGLEACRRAALSLYGKLRDDPPVLTPFEPQLDIVVWAPGGASTSEVSRRSQEIFERAAENGLHLAVAQLPTAFFSAKYPHLRVDQERMACLRSVLMKPEHEMWVERIWDLLQKTSY